MLRGARDIPRLAADLFSSEQHNGIGRACGRGTAYITGGTVITLPEAKRQLLVKICGMLGSNHDGERAAAGAQADALIRQLNLQWDDVIAPPPSLKPFHNPFSETPRPALGEGCFAEDLLSFSYLSEKQQACLYQVLMIMTGRPSLWPRWT